MSTEPYSHLHEMAKVDELMRTLTEIESSLNKAISELLSLDLYIVASKLPLSFCSS